MTTGFIDRGDADIMVETAACKVFCSEMGFRTVDAALQIMGGESYMTENVVERLWREPTARSGAVRKRRSWPARSGSSSTS